MAARLDLLVQQGSDFSRTMLFQRAGVPLDLTGYSFAGQIRKNINDTTVVAEFGFELFDQTGADKGKVRFFLTSAQTGAITLKAQKGQIKTSEPFAYDIEQTNQSGKIERILEGVANITPEVTRE